MDNILITGGCGFIGSNYIRYIFKNKSNFKVVNLDKLTYAGNKSNLKGLSNKNYDFVEGDICNYKLVESLFDKYHFSTVINFAAESHVDRSIEGPEKFIQTNVMGTLNLLEISRKFLLTNIKNNFRFLHISTDEVYGSLGSEGKFLETSQISPNSPYSASKASSDHLVNAWNKTYDLPTMITNCSNNYGPFQYPEKLIPLTIINCLSDKPLPVYGRGENIRDWLYVEDHCRAIDTVLKTGKIGETYNIGGCCELTNMQVVNTICKVLDEMYPKINEMSYKKLITFVEDRPGHDFRYAVDIKKIKNDLGWEPRESFENGIKKTINWYLKNKNWWNASKSSYEQKRLGLIKK